MTPRAAACPQCGRPVVSHAATPFLASGLCPACLFATAASIDDEECPYRVLAPIEQDGQGITYLAERGASRVRVLKSSVLPTPRRNMSLPWLPV